MPKVPGEPLRKVTLNLFDSDVAWFQERHGQGYSEIIRAVVRKHIERAGEASRIIEDSRRICQMLGIGQEEENG